MCLLILSDVHGNWPAGQACYAVYAEGQVQLKRIRYKVDRTLAALRASPLPPHVVQELAAVLGDTRA